MTHDEEVTNPFDALTDINMTPTEFRAVWDSVSREMKASSAQRGTRVKHWLGPIGAVALAVVVIAAGGLYAVNFKSNHEPALQKTTANPHLVQNVVLADSTLPGYSGQHLQLVDVKGQYTYDKNPGPFQGPNWTGQFELRLMGPVGRKTIFKLPLPSFFNHFTGKFKFNFANYNGNGFNDFALGQYASSNGFNYRLFEITQTGFKELPISPSPFTAADDTYSPLFPRLKPNGFQIEQYDNASASWSRINYVWTNGKFVKGAVFTDNQNLSANESRLVLPNGKSVPQQPSTAIQWKDVKLRLLTTSLPPAAAGSEGYAASCGKSRQHYQS